MIWYRKSDFLMKILWLLCYVHTWIILTVVSFLFLVIAIDIDPAKIALAHHNAELYGVADRIEFIVGDFFQLASMLKVNIILFLTEWETKDISVAVYS